MRIDRRSGCLAPSRKGEFILWALAAFAAATPSADAVTITGQNLARYARGRLPDRSDYNYLENYLSLNASLDRFRMSLRQSYKLPSELDRYWKSGLAAFDKRYIEYCDDYLSLRGGHFYRYWGRGLLFGNAELIELGLDSGLEGVLIEGSFAGFEGALYRGVEPDTAGARLETAEGVWLSYREQKLLPVSARLGVAFSRLDSLARHPDVDRSGVELELSSDRGELYIVYSYDKYSCPTARYHHGFYGAATLFGPWWGAVLEYKDYRLLNYGGVFGQPSLQFPPSGIPEATLHLLDRHPRQIRFGDDVGWQLELTFDRMGWDFRLNLNQSSQHGNAGGILPTLKEEDSPYRGMFATAERCDEKGNRLLFQGGFNEDVQFYPTAAGGFSEWKRRIAAGGTLERRLTPVYTIGCELELMDVNIVNRNERFWEHYLALSLTRSPAATITAMCEGSGDENEHGGCLWQDTFGGSAGARFWPACEVTLNPLERHRLTLFWGYERGGLRCSGGFCRWVNPFQGVKATLVSQF